MFVHDECNKKNNLFRFFSISELYKYAFCFILINKLKSDPGRLSIKPLCHLPTVWPDRSVVRVHTHSERVLGSSLGRVMGTRGVNSTREEKTYDQTGTPTQDLWQTAANSLTT